MESLINHAEFRWVSETIIKNFGDVKIDHITKLGEGMMNRTYLINQKFLFRFPKEKRGAFDLEKEKRLLPFLKNILLSTYLILFIAESKKMDILL
jgi:aminoglycoside 2''-phosphotransferase